MNMISNKIIDRLLNTLIVLFFATPFLLILYTQYQGSITGVGLEEMLETNIYYNIFFITSFIIPFIGFFMLNLKHKLVKEEESIYVIVLNLVIVAVSFLIMNHATYALFIAILVYFIIKEWGVKVKELAQYFKESNFNIKDWAAPIAILIIALVIRFMLLKAGSA